MLAKPEQRERALSNFTPERQAQIRKQLAWFDSLTREQQAIQIRRLERFARLLPAEKAAVQGQIQALNRLPQDRKQAVRRALTNVLNLSPEMRARRLSSPAFQSRFSPEELGIIRDLAGAWLPGPM
jgi:DNA-directed RNA polymerase beta' subunit